MVFNVKEINPKYDFQISGMSYIGNPKDKTCLFVVKKIQRMIKNLEGHKNCLVFIENGMSIPDGLQEQNCFVFVDNPQDEYGLFSLRMHEKEQKESANRAYKTMTGGYYLGENVSLGENVRIDPGCLIDHDVVIGDDAYIGFGSVVRNATIGNHFRCYEYSIIGTESFNPGHKGDYTYRVPSFGKVIIGNHVDIGSHVVIERGFNSDTVLRDGVMLDSGVIIGHDVILEDRTKITCGACVAGRVTVGRDTYIGMNSTIKQRLEIGQEAMVGMGSSVITNVKPETTVFGNPAKKIGI